MYDRGKESEAVLEFFQPQQKWYLRRMREAKTLGLSGGGALGRRRRSFTFFYTFCASGIRNRVGVFLDLHCYFCITSAVLFKIMLHRSTCPLVLPTPLHSHYQDHPPHPHRSPLIYSWVLHWSKVLLSSQFLLLHVNIWPIPYLAAYFLDFLSPMTFSSTSPLPTHDHMLELKTPNSSLLLNHSRDILSD